MRILMVYDHYPVCSGKYIGKAFERLGHEVRSCGQAYGTYVWGMHVNSKYIHNPTFWGQDTWQPDLVIIADSTQQAQDARQWEILSHIPGEVPFVVYGVDNHARAYGGAGIDHYFLAHNYSSLNDMSAENVTWLPCGFDDGFLPGTIPWHERAIDVLLCGSIYNRRATILGRLRAAGLRVLHLQGAIDQEYIDAHHHARIALNVSLNFDLAMRVFEGVALGCVVLTDPIPDLWKVSPVFPVCAPTQTRSLDNVPCPIWQFNEPQHAPAIAKHIINTHSTFAENIRHHTMGWLAFHAWSARAQTIMEWYAKHMEDKNAESEEGRNGDAVSEEKPPARGSEKAGGYR